MEYKSCEWIESRAVLAIDYLQFCCIPHSGTRGYVKMVPYKGGELPVDAIREARRSLIELNNIEGVETPCTGCHFLKKKDWDAERKSKALFDTVYVANFTVCNLRCRYCFVYINEAEDRPDFDYDVLPVFEELLTKGLLDPAGFVEWGGGEPTILPTFPQLQALLARTGVRQQIHTSGVRYSPEIEAGLRSGLLQVVTSIDAGTPETYLKVKGRDRHDVVWENMARYAKAGGDMALKYILRHDNSDPENIHQFVRKAEASGIKKIVITPDMREIAQHTVSEESIFGVALLMHEAKKRGLWAHIPEHYVNPADMRMLTRYVPLPLHAWRYRLYQSRRGLAQVAGAARRDAQRRRNAPHTRQAIRSAKRTLKRGWLRHPFQLLAAREDPGVLELLDYHTRNPDPELLATLKQIVAKKLVAGQPNKDGRAVVMGVTEKAWTTKGDPGFILVDGAGLEKPHVQEVWLACYAKENELPLKVTISDGSRSNLEYTFLAPERVRMELPAVPAGQTTLFSVRTDRTWEIAPGQDYGVQVTTRMQA